MSETTEKLSGFNFKTFLQDIRAEFNKVIWPSRADLVKQTITVIITSAIIGAVISGLDYIFAFGYQQLMGLVK